MICIEGVSPTFFVQDMRRSIDWYVRVLGFRVAFDAGEYAGVALGPATIHLAQRGTASSPDVRYKSGCYLRLTSGVDDYVAQIQATGQVLTATLKNHADYGMREATVRDPDGNDIYIGQPI